MIRSSLLSSTSNVKPWAPEPPVEKPGPVTLSAYVKRDGEEWRRVTRTIDRETLNLIMAQKPDINRDLMVARILGVESGYIDSPSICHIHGEYQDE